VKSSKFSETARLQIQKTKRKNGKNEHASDIETSGHDDGLYDGGSGASSGSRASSGDKKHFNFII
jgi:hypothetical protein